jgi:hypothetical protein
MKVRLSLGAVSLEASTDNWYYTDDNRIAITGGKVCLDKARDEESRVNTWDCSPGNTQQIWVV